VGFVRRQLKLLDQGPHVFALEWLLAALLAREHWY
jgi:hypothetical protein